MSAMSSGIRKYLLEDFKNDRFCRELLGTDLSAESTLFQKINTDVQYRYLRGDDTPAFYARELVRELEAHSQNTTIDFDILTTHVLNIQTVTLLTSHLRNVSLSPQSIILVGGLL